MGRLTRNRSGFHTTSTPVMPLPFSPALRVRPRSAYPARTNASWITWQRSIRETCTPRTGMLSRRGPEVPALRCALSSLPGARWASARRLRSSSTRTGVQDVTRSCAQNEWSLAKHLRLFGPIAFSTGSPRYSSAPSARSAPNLRDGAESHGPARSSSATPDQCRGWCLEAL
jgi:hypothetical protein